MQSKIIKLSLLASYALSSTLSHATEVSLDPIVISADFHNKKLSETSNAVSVIKEDKIADNALHSIESIVGKTANVNFSTGASRAHYLQIRGVGERSQFESTVNPSIGLIIDDIDVSENALALTSFDVHQIEVLKGPQGTKFGTNGMGGVITLKSNEPSKETQLHAEETVGNYHTKAHGLAIGGTLIEGLVIGRMSVFKNTSNGYMKNSTLDRENTQNIDELTAKAKLRWFASENHTIDLNAMHVNVDNGYDAFTLNNSRTSHADQPGHDRLKLNALSLKSTYQLEDILHMVTKTSFSKSKMQYAYDVDWTDKGEYAAGYSAFDQYNRQRQKADFDMRVISDKEGRLFYGTLDWSFGAYYKEQSEALVRNYTYFDKPYKSDLETKTMAVYGQLDMAVTPVLTLIAGARLEKWQADFSDNYRSDIETDESLLGAKAGFVFEANRHKMYYMTLSKGYKPGGINSEKDIPLSDKAYKTETLWNLDFGVNSHYYKGTLTTRFNVFYGLRKDQQVKSSLLLANPNGSTRFLEYLDNAAKTHYYGVEYQATYSPVEDIHLFANIGVLRSKFDSYDNANKDAYDVTGRSTATAPRYQYNFGMDTMITENWNFKVDMEGKSEYYFSNRHAGKARAYSLLNTSITYLAENWSVQVWAKNIANVEYETRGFGSFGNNPSNGYETELYTQKGTPRTYGLTVGYDF